MTSSNTTRPPVMKSEKPTRCFGSADSFFVTEGSGQMSSSTTAIRVRTSSFVTLKTM